MSGGPVLIAEQLSLAPHQLPAWAEPGDYDTFEIRQPPAWSDGYRVLKFSGRRFWMLVEILVWIGEHPASEVCLP